MKTKFKSFGNIHTNLGILLAMLLAQTGSAETWFTNEVWISTKAQTNGGNGTLDYPYDGSTQVKFDAVMNNLLANTTIHLLAGTYQTFGNSSGGSVLKSGQKVLGSGIDNTIVQLAPSAPAPAMAYVIVNADGYCSNNVVSDLTLNANYISGTVAYGGVCLFGSHNTVRNVKVINNGGSASCVSRGIALGVPGEGNVVENCEIGPVVAYVGFGIDFDNSIGGMIGGIIRNNHIFFTGTPSGIISQGIVGTMRNTLIEGNYVKGACAGIYGGGTNIMAAHNVFEDCLAPIFLLNAPSQNSTFCYNTITYTTSMSSSPFRFDSTGSYTNIAIIGNTVTFNGNQPGTGSMLLWGFNINGLILANNTVEPSITCVFTGCTNVSMYNNYDLKGNFLTNLNQVASPNGVTRKTVTYSGTGIYTNYASYADKYIGVKGITSANNGKVSIVLPSAVGHAGKDFVVVDESGQLSSTSRFIKIQATSPDQINGQSAITNSTPYTAKTVISDGTYWFAR